MAARLGNKVALITGGAGAIGSEMSRLFAAEGAVVVFCDVEAARGRGEALAKSIETEGGRALFVRCDVTSAEEVDGMFRLAEERFGGLDVLVNNAIDIRGDTTITSLDEEDWERVIGVCLKGTFLCTRRAIPLFEARGGGSIVTISSVNALFGFGHTAYTAAKGGLISMMRLVAAEYGDRNIRSNVICPGTIMTQTSMEIWESNPEGFAKLKAMYPMGKLGTTRDVANFALFLASDESAFVTGSVQVVDGGILAGRKFEF